jgi:hypothetical protein
LPAEEEEDGYGSNPSNCRRDVNRTNRRQFDWAASGLGGRVIFMDSNEVGGAKGSLYALGDVAIDDEVEEFGEGSNLDGCAKILLLCTSVRRS